jgi:hypothetical protein
MPKGDRMFHVIVRGGVLLGGGTVLLAAGCGSSTETAADAQAPIIEAGPSFPHEGADAGPPLEAGQDVTVGFPHEGADAGPPLEAGQDVTVGFPHEGADAGPPLEAGQDVYDAFPHEDAEGGLPIDAGKDVFPQEGADANP